MDLRTACTVLFLLTLHLVNAQDTLHLVYAKSVVDGNKGSLFEGDEQKYFYSIPKKVVDHWVIYIQHDTARYEIQWKGSTRKLLRKEEQITQIQQVIKLMGEDEYRYTINNVAYVLKRVKGNWGCYAGEEKILTIDFYKENKKKIVRVITNGQSPQPAHLLVTTLYGVDELIKDKKTTFGQLLRTHMIMQLIK